MSIIVGIDGGLDGGVTIFRDGAVTSLITPTIGQKGKGKRQYDLQSMCELLGQIPIVDSFAWLERAQPMRGGARDGDTGARGGVQAAFSQGFGHGAWQALLVALRIPYEIVSAVTWQKELHRAVVGNDTKAKSEIVCKRLWPNVDWRRTPRCTTVHDGMTDSACIAEYGRRQMALRGAA